MSENEIKPVAWVDLDVWIATNDAGDSFFTDYQDDDTVAVYDQSSIDRLTAERDAAVADADRYRWLRREGAWAENYLSRKGGVSALFVSDGRIGHATDGDELDAAIDAARAEVK